MDFSAAARGMNKGTRTRFWTNFSNTYVVRRNPILNVNFLQYTYIHVFRWVDSKNVIIDFIFNELDPLYDCKGFLSGWSNLPYESSDWFKQMYSCMNYLVGSNKLSDKRCYEFFNRVWTFFATATSTILTTPATVSCTISTTTCVCTPI